ncbi:MAG: MBL fold metallo-hydrolase [Candidatus Electrothrix sp. EH2]|nr:MBL fold metallo-hydrolase [Candidatus Electrothrix sp. EH2]
MRVVALIENTKPEDREELIAEHGLALYIEQDHRRILFDTGATGAFAHNAQKLGVNLEDVDAVVISHHHYDHGGGLACFTEENRKAKIYLRKSNEEDYCFRAFGVVGKYIGLDQSLLQQQADRFEFIDCFTEIIPSVYILTDIPQHYARPKRNRRLCMKQGGRYVPDRFQHELIMVIREEAGLIVFTGCAHNGILNMIEAVKRQFKNEPIRAVFGGFHLAGSPTLNIMAESQKDIKKIGEKLLTYSVGQVYTGHCTGKRASDILKQVMGDQLEYFATGSEAVLGSR